MIITIDFKRFGIVTISHDFTWKSDCESFAKLLNTLRNSNSKSPNIPHPEYVEAQRMLAKFKDADVVSVEMEDWDMKNPMLPGVIY